MLALAAVSGCVATDAGLAPTASYSSDLSASGDLAVTLPDTVAVLPVSSGRAETEVAYADPADFAASSFAGPEPSSAVAAQPVALMPRTRPLAVVEGGDEDLNRLIEKYATLYEVPVQLVRRVVKRESNFYPGAYNHGHWGLMQIKHATARGMGYDGSARGLLDAETNLKYRGEISARRVDGGRRQSGPCRTFLCARLLLRRQAQGTARRDRTRQGQGAEAQGIGFVPCRRDRHGTLFSGGGVSTCHAG